MSDATRRDRGWLASASWRIGVTAVSIGLLQTIVCGLAVLPPALLWAALAHWAAPSRGAWIGLVSIGLVPSYAVFALCLMAVSSVVNRLVGLRTPGDAEMRIADAEWRLMRWVQYVAAIHVVRALAGVLFRGSPVWTAYLRLNGARIGRRVYVNTLSISDHNLLELGDDVVIGADVHVSGHTVEAGVVKTAGVRLGHGVTIGIGTTIGIDVEIGAGSQVGALSLVPKHTTLEARAVYAGIPVRRLQPSAPRPSRPPTLRISSQD
jgi:acetyltransferase-like isoleucine patch superfamily enzyme